MMEKVSEGNACHVQRAGRYGNAGASQLDRHLGEKAFDFAAQVDGCLFH
jgi:hypothetical protein